MDHRDWNKHQTIFRQLLIKDQQYTQAIDAFLAQHAVMHSAELSRGLRWSYQDEVLSKFLPEQMRAIPKGNQHSVAWMVWHITRIEDVTLNVLLADAMPVFETKKWQSRLGISYIGVGNELSRQAIFDFSQDIDLPALLAYRLAVGKRTQSIVRRVKSSEWVKYPASARLERLEKIGAVEAQSAWLLRYWGHNPNANLLLMPATRHAFVHLNEAKRMLPKLKRLDKESM